jgi:hypothetical protein
MKHFGRNGYGGAATFEEDDEELPALLSESDDDEDGVLESNAVKIKSKL